MPSNTGSLRLVQWPLFLLSGKVSLKCNKLHPIKSLHPSHVDSV